VYSILNQYQINLVKNVLTVAAEELKFSGSASGCGFGDGDDIFVVVTVNFFGIFRRSRRSNRKK
jgi:hypothetical protein